MICFYNERNFRLKQELYNHQMLEYKPEMTGTSHQYKQMPYLMESEYAGEWIGFFDGIDNGPAAVKQSAQGQPEQTGR